MGHRERTAAYQRAHELGAQARQAGKPQSANPYKRGGLWSLYPAWWVGWTEADNVAKRQEFKTVTSGAGYNPNHMSRGKNTVTLHGVECPCCKHQFMPASFTEPAKCPSCGFAEKVELK